MEELIKKRRSLKGAITRIQTFFEANPNVSIVQTQVRLESLENNFKKYEAIQAEIDNIAEDINDEEKYRQEVEDKYFNIKVRCLDIIQGQNVSSSVTQDSSSESNDTTSAILQSLSQQQAAMKAILERISNQPSQTNCDRSFISNDENIKLPRVNIPPFSGQYEDWPAFHDLYTTLVHNNTKLSPSEKFQFLKTSLKGEAASNLKHLPISDANYVEAWEQLKSTYNKEKYIIEAHLKNIFEAVHLQPQPSPSSIRKLSNTFKESVRALKALKLQTDEWDCWLNYVLIQKLDCDSRQLWARSSASENRPSFKSLLEFLEQREF